MGRRLEVVWRLLHLAERVGTLRNYKPSPRVPQFQYLVSLASPDQLQTQLD